MSIFRDRQVKFFLFSLPYILFWLLVLAHGFAKLK